jgi:hypothetical protein
VSPSGVAKTSSPATNKGEVMEAGGFREESSGAVLTAALTGLGAAIVGGVAWGLIVKWTDYEIGFAAWGIGFIVGTAVAFGGQGRRGTPFQLLAVVLALVGIVLGKYLAFVWIGQDVLDKAGFTLSLPVFSSQTIRLFWDGRTDIWSGWDLLWAGLAVVTAFRIPQREQAKPAPEAAAGSSGLPPAGEPAPAVDGSADWADRVQTPAERGADR